MVVIWWWIVVLATCLILMVRTFLIVGSQSSLITDVTTPTLHRPHWQHCPHNTLHTHTCTHHTVASQNGTIPTEKQMDLAIVVSKGSQVTLLSEGWNSTRVKIGSQLLSLMNAVFLCGCNHHVFPFNYNMCTTCICIYIQYILYVLIWIYIYIYTYMHIYMYTYIWVNYNDLTATSLEIMVSKGNHQVEWP